MSDKAWPFLIARHPVGGYRVVVAPDFMCQADTHSLLLLAASGAETGPGEAHCRQVILKAGQHEPVTLVFRKIRAQRRDVGQAEDGELISGGRSNPIFEGLVVQGRQADALCSRQAVVTQADLDRVHRDVLPAFTAFWRSEKPPRPLPSTPVPTARASAGAAPLALRRQQDWPPPNLVVEEVHPGKMLVAMALAGLAFVGAVIRWVIRR